MLPQWALELMRPLIRGVSQALWRVSYEGLKNVPRDGGLIIASNHQTYIDPFWISLPIKRPQRYLAWNEAFDWPLVGKLMELLGAWPLQLERSDPTAIKRTLQWLHDGGAVVIFPEGGRCELDGKLMRFKNGAVRMAVEAGVPILPVTIRGGHRVWPNGYNYPRLAKVDVIYHPLFHPTIQQGEEIRHCARRESDRLAEIIKSAL